MSERKSIIPIFIPHLGCPCHCVFCNQRSITSVDVEPLSAIDPEEVPAIIEKGLSLSGSGAELAFYGGSFSALPDSLMQSYLHAAHPYVMSGQLSGIRVSTRPDAIDAYRLDLLKRYGVRTIELGAQSMDDDVLLRSKRGHTAEETVSASRLIRAHGIALILQMMVGLPGEDRASVKQSAELIAGLKPDGVRIYPVAVIKNTELAKMWRDGAYQPLTLEAGVELCADLIGFFEERGIPVIRVGLNPSDTLEQEILAGVYHPAFGELCRSRMMLQETRRMLSDRFPEHSALQGKSILFGVARGKTSHFVGQHRQNLKALIQEFGVREIKVREHDLDGSEPAVFPAGKLPVEILDIF